MEIYMYIYKIHTQIYLFEGHYETPNTFIGIYLSLYFLSFPPHLSGSVNFSGGTSYKGNFFCVKVTFWVLRSSQRILTFLSLKAAANKQSDSRNQRERMNSKHVVGALFSELLNFSTAYI